MTSAGPRFTAAHEHRDGWLIGIRGLLQALAAGMKATLPVCGEAECGWVSLPMATWAAGEMLVWKGES